MALPRDALPAVHRLVVLRNDPDGLAVDFQSGNRRLVLNEPTSVFASDGGQSLSPQARTRFQEEYKRRFLGTVTDDVECLRALHQHLKKVVQVRLSSTAQWEKALIAIMRGSKFGSPRAPTRVAARLARVG
jgi:hypothetical protein